MSKKSTEVPNDDNEVNDTPSTQKKMCGVIMPIANTPGYELGHWKDVLSILEDALKETNFEAKLVSERIDIGLIHEQIVTNIYENEIIICDVSSKNPNVMFELGMRLAFDKPTIIIKDEKTDYSFDIGGILHLEYPSSLRHNIIEKFKSDLRTYVEATHIKSKTEPEYSPFLKAFGRHIVAKSITNSEISESQFIIEKLNTIEKKIITNENRITKITNAQSNTKKLELSLESIDFDMREQIVNLFLKYLSARDLEDMKQKGAYPSALFRSIRRDMEHKFGYSIPESVLFELLEDFKISD